MEWWKDIGVGIFVNLVVGFLGKCSMDVHVFLLRFICYMPANENMIGEYDRTDNTLTDVSITPAHVRYVARTLFIHRFSLLYTISYHPTLDPSFPCP